MGSKIKRCLYVGMGGTGMNALLHTKKMFVDTYGEVPPMIGFMGIDTDGNQYKKTLPSTTGEEICELLLRESHHGITVLEATGAYTKEKKNVLHLVVSSFQITEIVAHIKNIDESSFILQVPVSNIYGRFYIPPFK